MFTLTDFYKGPLNIALSAGKIEVILPIFREFNEYLNNNGFEIILSSFYKESGLVTIYVKSSDTNIPIESSNIGGELKTNLKQTILDIWFKLYEKYAYDITKIDKGSMKVFIYDFEKIYMTELIYKFGEEIIEKINNTYLTVKPEYVFKSSKPCFYIVYSNLKNYEKVKAGNDFELIKEVINNSFLERDLIKCYRKGLVEINFYHKGMVNLNLYGLSRED